MAYHGRFCEHHRPFRHASVTRSPQGSKNSGPFGREGLPEQLFEHATFAIALGEQAAGRRLGRALSAWLWPIGTKGRLCADCDEAHAVALGTAIDAITQCAPFTAATVGVCGLSHV
jgi:hypothetical protein